MNKLLCTSIALAGLAIFPAAHARSTAATDAGFFVGAKAGQGYFNGDSDQRSNTYTVDLGYRWALGNRNNLGIEFGYVKPNDLEYDSLLSNSNMETKAWSVGANYQVTFGGNGSGPHWFFAARAGYMHWTQDTLTNVSSYGQPYAYRDSVTGTGSYAGVGLGFDFNEHVGMGLYYDYYLADISRDQYGNYYIDDLSVPSLGLEIRF